MENIDYRVLIERMEPRENVIDHIANILDMLLPIRGGRILHIGPGNWPHEEGLGVKITDWMDEVAQQRPDLNPFLERDFENRLSLVRVRFQHLLGDFWLIKTYPCRLQQAGQYRSRGGSRGSRFPESRRQQSQGAVRKIALAADHACRAIAR